MQFLRRFKVFAALAIVLSSMVSANAGPTTSSQVSNPWFLEATLSATGNPLQFGFVVSISGNTIVTCAGGQVYIFVRKGSKWISTTQTAILSASDGSYLSSAAISGNTIVAGSGSTNNGVGAAYVFVEPSGGWTASTETAKLTASDAIAGDFFGSSVAIAGNTIVVGAVQNNSVGARYPEPNGSGAAYVYSKPTGGWANMTETAKLTASDGAAGDDFGYSVIVLGDTIAAGAPNVALGSTYLAGAVYVFQKTGTQWVSTTESGKLTASDARDVGVLGISMGISGNTIAAAGFDSVDLFIRPASGWRTATQNAELADPNIYFFGLNSVAICNEYVLAGSPYTYSHPIADLYIEPSTGWANMAPTNRFSVPAGNGNGTYGWSAAINGSTLAIGSPLNAGAGGNVIYVYALN